MASLLPPVVVTLLADTAEFNAKFDEAAEKTGAFGDVASKALLGVGAAVAAVGGFSVDMALKFQDSTTQLANNAGISVTAAQAIGNAFLNTAGKSTFSANEMVQAYSSIAGQLGVTEGHALTATQAMTVMQAATDLADATGQSLATTTDSLGRVMQAYQIPVAGAAQATDILFNVGRDTNNTTDTLAQTFGKLRTNLGPLSPTLADTGTLLLDLNEHGLTGTRGLMAVSSGLSTLLGGSKKTDDELGSLGITLYNSSGQFVGMGNVIDQLAPKLAGMTQQQQLAATQALFGAGASKKLIDTIIAGQPAWDTAAQQATALGTAHQAAQNHAQTFGGVMETLKATIVDQGIKIGNQLLPYLMQAAQWLGQNLPAAVTAVSGVLSQLTAFISSDVVPAIGAMASWMGEHVLPIWNQFAGWVGNTLIPALMQLWGAFERNVLPVLVTIGQGFVAVLAAMVPVAEFIVGTLIGAITFMANNFSVFGPILLAAAAGFAIFKASLAIQALIQGVSMGMYMLQAGIQGVAVAEVGGESAMYSFGVALDVAMGPIGIAAAAIGGIALVLTNLGNISHFVGSLFESDQQKVQDAINATKQHMEDLSKQAQQTLSRDLADKSSAASQVFVQNSSAINNSLYKLIDTQNQASGAVRVYEQEANHFSGAIADGFRNMATATQGSVDAMRIPDGVTSSWSTFSSQAKDVFNVLATQNDSADIQKFYTQLQEDNGNAGLAVQQLATTSGGAWKQMAQDVVTSMATQRTAQETGAGRTIALWNQMYQQYLSTETAQQQNTTAGQQWAQTQANNVVPGAQAARDEVQKLATAHGRSYQNMLDIIQYNPGYLNSLEQDDAKAQIAAQNTQQFAGALGSVFQGIANLGKSGGMLGNLVNSIGNAINHVQGRQGGGDVLPGQLYVVGEDGPEILGMGSYGGHVYPNRQLQQLTAVGGAPGGSGYTVDARIINPVFNGTPRQMLGEMQAMIQDNNRDIVSKLRQIGAAA